MIKFIGGFLVLLLYPICTIIWETAELFNVSLGKLAPYIFGGMIGRMPHKINQKGKQNK